MKLKDIMTPHVEEVDCETSIQNAAEIMQRLDVGALPVMEHGRPVGIVTDRDLAVRGLTQDTDPRDMPVRNVMTCPIQTLTEDLDLREAARLMERRRIRRVLIVNNANEITGIVSLGDLAVHGGDLRLGGEVLEAVSEPGRPRRGAF